MTPFMLSLSVLLLIAAPAAYAGDDATPLARPHFQAGPDGTVALGNKTCPVMGNAVDGETGIAHNGWWIGFCCPGCDDKFKADIDANAAKLLQQTGVDVRRHPASYVVRPKREFADGPNGTKVLGNKTCPVMGNPSKPDCGIAHNGWWVTFCCPGCDDKLKGDVDKYAAVLLDETGIDIRKTPASYSRSGSAAFQPGPDGSIQIGNATCPVLGNNVDAEKGCVVNGWWIGICCPGCDRKLESKPEDYAADLISQTGIDIRISPLRYMVHPKGAPPITDREFKAGPNGTVQVGNADCPLMGKPVKDRYGVEHNGWWIHLCCSRCRREAGDKMHEIAAKILEATGVDINKTPAELGVQVSGE